MMHAIRRLAPLVLLLVLVTSCGGTLSVGFEQTPTPNPAPEATLQALVEENERLSRALATAIAPAPPPPTALGRVAYIRGGDLWVALLPEGPHQRLTIDGHNREPHWSSSGEWIAYRKDRTVLEERDRPCDEPLRQGQSPCHETVSTYQQQMWLTRRTGDANHVINRGFTVETFAWSPTDDLLAYISDAGHLQTIDPVTDITTRLVSGQGANRVEAIAWSPDGQMLAYEWVSDEQVGQSGNREDGIWIVPARGGQPLRLVRAGQSPVNLAGWQDQDHVLIWEHQGSGAQTDESAWLYSVTLPAQGESAGAPQIVQAEPMLQRRDFLSVAAIPGRTIAVTVGASLPTWTNKRIVAGSFQSSSGLAAITPAWAPDGQRLAFPAMPDRPGLTLGETTTSDLLARHIEVASVGAGSVQPLTGDPRYRDERPLWSRQGSHILFARVTGEGQASLWLIPVDGGEPALVVDELTPAPDPIGTYGYIDWAQHFDWWRG